MGTMLQGYDLTMADFDQLEGCNEVLNRTRPDIVRAIHDAYFEVGVDAVETNTFGTNLSALGEYGISEQIFDLSERAARIARESADAYSTADRARWVLGSVGPGTKLPTLGHVAYRQLRDAYQTQVEGMLAGGIDAVLIETSQDLLQTKAATLGAKRALAHAGRDLPVIVHVTVETTGTMLLGSEIGAALTALEPLGIDLIGLNCATGPAEMSEHLRHLSRYAQIGVSCMPNAGLPQLTADGAHYPLKPVELADALEQFVGEFGLGLVGGCCGTGPEHLRQVVDRLTDRPVPPRRPAHLAAAASLYAEVPFRQDTSYLSIGERTNANGSRAFRDALLEERWDDCVDIARAQIRDGAHLLDLNIDYVGRDGAADMRELAFRLATASTLPLVLDSTEPAVLQAGLECLGGRAVINSVNYEDGDGPDSRFTKIMSLVREHGAAVIALTIDEQGQARTADWKVAGRRPDHHRHHPELGAPRQRHHHRLPDLPDRHRTGGDPPRRDRDDRGDPGGQAPVPRRADDPRAVEHLLRSQPGGPGRAQLGVPQRVHRRRSRLGHRARRQDHPDGPDPRRTTGSRPRHGLRPAASGDRHRAGVRPAAGLPRAVRRRDHR